MLTKTSYPTVVSDDQTSGRSKKSSDVRGQPQSTVREVESLIPSAASEEMAATS